MSQTIGYHLVKSGFGLWLPGDDRGSWSEAWDEQIGYHEPRMLHPGDAVRRRMAEERMKRPPVRFSRPMIAAMSEAIRECAANSPWKIAAASIESTHLHLLITYSGMEFDRTAKWLAQQMTKEVHRRTTHKGPVFCEGRWRGFIFDKQYWHNAICYIERHNLRRGETAWPYAFLTP